MRVLNFLTFFETFFQNNSYSYFLFEKSNVRQSRKNFFLIRKAKQDEKFFLFFLFQKKNLLKKNLLRQITILSIFKEEEKHFFLILFFKKKYTILKYLNIFLDQKKKKILKNFDFSIFFSILFNFLTQIIFKKNFHNPIKKYKVIYQNKKDYFKREKLLKKLFFLKLTETNFFFLLKKLK
ncbi:hypothetical protein HAN_3g514 (nucleomorph) [Hemiselmis andersenii]|uniref:Uncharacterized protein n=1 Tax=Hemiselmis andersenii TaxID=464988 RepID=A9BLD2_HEMAN|nr:hypothetical protein HAN_3g514 [Hemiselmis andersenii]ABW98315.1 hypothetical protein HAN_3g514 [Hemiselmis andersenii]